jgi:GT2 family glycosyltransferase
MNLGAEDSSHMAPPQVVSVILNTNRREDTLACLLSLQGSTYPRHAAIVLDNASTDGSVESIRSSFPAVEVVPLAENRGYAGNNNVGLQVALQRGADWVFVLNEDTIVDAECLSRLVGAAETDARNGFVGPTVYHHDEPDVIQSAGGELTSLWEARHLEQNEADRGQVTAPRPVDWITGCAMLVRRAVIEEVGALDARFFYYWEEVEWCLRARKAGWRVLHVPRARLWHKGVQRAYRPGPSVRYYDTRNRFLMLAKHRAPLPAWVCAWWHVTRTLASWTLRPVHRPMREHRNAMWCGVMDFLGQRWGARPRRAPSGPPRPG